MNPKQIHRFVERYLEATGCTIMEKSPAHFKVKLSPAADRELTNRPYYWSFVDRTGAEPETMSLLLVTDAARYDALTADAAQTGAPHEHAPQTNAAQSAVTEQAGMAALSRSFGFVPGSLGARMPREDLHYGSRRLEQLFAAARRGGRFVCLFQQPDEQALHPYDSLPVTPWLAVNVKVSFVCDMKREELHAFGVSLVSGDIVESFFDRLKGLRLTPRLPQHIHVAGASVTLKRAAGIIEQTLERKLKTYDYGWAAAANERLKEELAQLAHYYEPLLEQAGEEERPQIEEQYRARREEMHWQLSPRVIAEVVNAGIFHLSGLG